MTTQEDKCSGCGRNEVHKMCPAYGTAFYMSGFEFTEEIERAIRIARTSAFANIDFIFIQILQKYGSGP